MRPDEQRIELEHQGHTILEHWGEAGPNILCIHGITSSRKGWTRFANRFFLANRVWAYDQRGHGDSSGVHGPMTLDQSVRDLQRVADAIPGGIDVVIGHSWGGAVALRGGRVLGPRRVVAVDPMLRVPPGTFFADYVEDLEPLFELQGADREQRVLEMYAGVHELDRDAKVHALAHMSIEPIRRLGSENGVDEGRWDLREVVADYPVPLLLPIAGVDSVVAPEDLAFARERGGRNVTVAVFEGHGHSLHRSAFDAFSRMVEEFI
jgi:pimeloyl-ACP methyl ester carboxylesterase